MSHSDDSQMRCYCTLSYQKLATHFSLLGMDCKNNSRFINALHLVDSLEMYFLSIQLVHLSQTIKGSSPHLMTTAYFQCLLFLGRKNTVKVVQAAPSPQHELICVKNYSAVSPCNQSISLPCSERVTGPWDQGHRFTLIRCQPRLCRAPENGSQPRQYYSGTT